MALDYNLFLGLAYLVDGWRHSWMDGLSVVKGLIDLFFEYYNPVINLAG